MDLDRGGCDEKEEMAVYISGPWLHRSEIHIPFSLAWKGRERPRVRGERKGGREEKDSNQLYVYVHGQSPYQESSCAVAHPPLPRTHSLLLSPSFEPPQPR